jgi:hypothetical protein
LDKLGFVWDPFEADWEEGFRYLTMYKERTGHCSVPATHNEKGFGLGGWVRSQRFHRDKLSEERRQRLEELGFIWDARGSDWDEGFRYLTIYKKRTGHCRIPALHKEDGYPLGRWADKQRQRQRDLSEERQRRLNDVGFVWDVLDAAWDDGFGYLTIYKNRTGHCRVPALHKENGSRLGQWVSVQRLNKEALSEERQRRLDKWPAPGLDDTRLS